MSPRETDLVEVVMASHPKLLPLVRALVDEGARAAGFPPEERHRIVLAVTEGVSNVMRHGYGGQTDERIDLFLRVPRGEFRLDIQDYGEFVSPDQMRSRPLGEVRPGGLGVHLMQATMDTVSYRKNAHGGTTLTLVKRLSSLSHPEESS